MDTPDGLMTSAQAAAAIGCSTRTLARLVVEHRIGCVRWGAGRRRPRIGFTAQHVQEYLTSCQVFAELPSHHLGLPRVGQRLERRIGRDQHT